MTILRPSGDFMLDVAAGLIPKKYAVNKFGRATNCDSGVSTDVWDRANATDDQDIWVAPTQARVHAIVSTDAGDDGSPGGVGARTIRVYGLTSWSLPEVSEDITLNGVGAVNTANAYVIIHRMKVLTYGASGPNVGQITATAATDGTVTAQILAGQGQTQMAVYGVPSVEVAYATSYYAATLRAVATAAINVSLIVNPQPSTSPIGFLTKHTLAGTTTGTSSLMHPFAPYYNIAGPAIIKVQVVASATNVDVSAGFDLIRVRS